MSFSIFSLFSERFDIFNSMSLELLLEDTLEIFSEDSLRFSNSAATDFCVLILLSILFCMFFCCVKVCDFSNFASCNWSLRSWIFLSIIFFWPDNSDWRSRTDLISESLDSYFSSIEFFKDFFSWMDFFTSSSSESTWPWFCSIFSSSFMMSGILLTISSSLFFEVFIWLSASVYFPCSALNSWSMPDLACWKASSFILKADFSSSIFSISLFSTDCDFSNCSFSDKSVCCFSSFSDFSFLIFLSFPVASMALNRSNSCPIISWRIFRFRSISSSSICFLTSPIFAIATSKRWSAWFSVFSASAFFSSKAVRPTRSSRVFLFSSFVISEILVTVPCWTAFSWLRPALAISKMSRILFRLIFLPSR